MPAYEPAIERFRRRVAADEHGCWEWTGARLPAGYGRFWTGERMDLAHRFSYETFVGPIPAGLVLDHLCRNKGCVRPDHLEAVTQRENLRRGDVAFGDRHHNGRRTECRRGHLFTNENTRHANGRRVCRACERDRR